MKLESFQTGRFLGIGLGVFFCWTVLAVVSGCVPDYSGPGYNTSASEKTGSEAGVLETPREKTDAQAPDGSPVAQEERFKRVEDTLASIKSTLHEADTRTYQNKMMARQLFRLVYWIVGLLVVIAVIIPVTLLYVGRRRPLAAGALSPDMASTLVAVEERQAKLGNILKEIQGEIDYIHSMSVPDLKKLIEQAEKYIEQNEKDLERATVPGKTVAKADKTPVSPVKPS